MTKELAVQYQALLRDLTTAVHRAYERGIQLGSGGNGSIRIPGENKMIVSVSGHSFADCREDGTGWTIADFSARGLCGETPSKESGFHGYIYSRFPGVHSIVHCHAPWSIAWADRHDRMQYYTWQSKVKLPMQLRVFDQSAAAVPVRDFEKILSQVGEGETCSSFILRRHGIVAVGATAVEAEHMAEFIEECAQVELLRRMSPASSGI